MLEYSARKRIAVIGGGGASGLAILKVFLDRPQLQGPDASWEIHAYEARRDVGGIWLPEVEGETTEYPGTSPVPSTPLYHSLTTNLPHPLMSYHDFPFPPETTLYPHANVVQAYIASYANRYDLRQYIDFDTLVQKVVWDDATSQWIVTHQPKTGFTKSTYSSRFDAIIVANGHYGLPYRPPLSGIDSWETSGRRIIHSAWYREPSIFRGLVVLVIGGGPSGLDLVKDTVGIARTMIHSTAQGSRVDDDGVKRRSRVVELRAADGTAIYNDGSSDSGIDFVVLATGYTLTFPFLPDVPNDSNAANRPMPDRLACTGSSLYPLAHHTFPLRTYSPKTLAFVGLPSRLAPLPAMDTQAHAIATVFLDDGASQPVWNQQGEEELVQDRFALMHQKFQGNTDAIAHSWHKMFSRKENPGFEELGDFDDYREALLHLGRVKAQEWAVPAWEQELFDVKFVLREEWLTLEKEGVANAWVRGVGKGDPHEWVSLMYRVLEHARQRSQPQLAQVEVDASHAV